MSTSGPTWAPIVEDGSVIRFAANEAGLAQPPSVWGPKRVSSFRTQLTPSSGWSPNLIASRPGWLQFPRGPDVPAAMQWFPLLTFELVLVDMPAAGAMPPGIGHDYLPNIGPAWVSVLSQPNWSPHRHRATAGCVRCAVTSAKASLLFVRKE